jgi:hypothetical protein
MNPLERAYPLLLISMAVLISKRQNLNKIASISLYSKRNFYYAASADVLCGK